MLNRKIYRVCDEAKFVSALMKRLGFRDRSLYYRMRPKCDVDKAATPVGRLSHRAFCLIFVRHDNDAGVGKEVEIRTAYGMSKVRRLKALPDYIEQNLRGTLDRRNPESAVSPGALSIRGLSCKSDNQRFRYRYCQSI